MVQPQEMSFISQQMTYVVLLCACRGFQRGTGGNASIWICTVSSGLWVVMELSARFEARNTRFGATRRRTWLVRWQMHALENLSLKISRAWFESDF